MKKQENIPITLDLELHEQSVNIDVESVAPHLAFVADAFDVANSTITARVNNTSGAPKQYRLAIRADIENGASATVRVISGDKATFKNVVEFKRIVKANSMIVEPILPRAGLVLDSTKPRQQQLIDFAKQFKIADIDIPAGIQVLRIHLSQKLSPVAGSPKQFHLESYLPLMSFAPIASVLLGATLVFPLHFTNIATILECKIVPIPGRPAPNLTAGGDTAIMLARQQCYGWEFQNVDPLLTATWIYN